MKKLIAFTVIAFAGLSAIFAASYTNNTYQKLAKEYTKKAQVALDAGKYDLAEEYAAKAKENADLSDAFIRSMMARDFADKDIKEAKARIEAVKKMNGDKNFPIAFETATKNLSQAESEFANENWEKASYFAKQVLTTLADVYEITPLPKYYIVKPWATNKDCFWNISGRPYVYNNPWLWENLYQANKKSLPKPEDPNLILPGMKMEIPSLTGEIREGTYDPKIKYEPYKAH